MEVGSLLEIYTRADLYRWFVENHATAKEFWIRSNRSKKDTVIYNGNIRIEGKTVFRKCET